MQTKDEIVEELCRDLQHKTDFALIFEALWTLIRHTAVGDYTPDEEALLLEISRRTFQTK